MHSAALGTLVANQFSSTNEHGKTRWRRENTSQWTIELIPAGFVDASTHITIETQLKL